MPPAALVTRPIIVYAGGVDFDAYAQTAADLANVDLTDLDALRAFFGEDQTWWVNRVNERDLTTFRRAQRKLRAVFVHGSAGEDAEAVEILNALLEQFPVQPRISGHPGNDWHMHVTGRGSSVASEFIAGSAWGLSAWLCRYKGARFGVCADARCGNVYLDTSSNCCRRFCSERCATRSHVAAHRVQDHDLLSSETGGIGDCQHLIAPIGVGSGAVDTGAEQHACRKESFHRTCPPKSAYWLMVRGISALHRASAGAWRHDTPDFAPTI